MSVFILDSEEAYWNHEAVSRSDLKLLMKSPQLFRAKKDGDFSPYKSNKGMRKGSLVDEAILESERFEAKFVKEPKDLKTPRSKKEKEFCNRVIDGDNPVETYSDIYKVGSKSAEEIEDKATGKIEKFADYIEFEVGKMGRTAYSHKDSKMIESCLSSVKDHKRAKNLLLDRDLTRFEETQLPIVFDLKGVRLRVLLDKVIVDVKNKVVKNVELKTTGKSIHRFPRDYRNYLYHFQQVMYGIGLKQALLNVPEYFCPMECSPEEVLDVAKNGEMQTLCVAIEQNNLCEVRVFDMSERLKQEGIQLFKDLHQRLLWHRKHDMWEMTREEYETGSITIGTWKEDNV